MNELTFQIHEMPTLQDGTKFNALPDDYEPGVPIGYGATIQDAIESLLESYELKFDSQPLTYKWK